MKKQSNQKLKIYSFDQVKDEFIGTVGTSRRDAYEVELQLDLIGDLIRETRKKRKFPRLKAIPIIFHWERFSNSLKL